jgi:hypothetical protein
MLIMTRYTRHEVTALRAGGSSGRTRVILLRGCWLGSVGSAGDQEDARRGAESADAGGGWKALGGEVSEQSPGCESACE